MDITKKLYQDLTPKQRGIAAYAAIKRGDHAEVDRLVAHAPKSAGHGRTMLAIGQALDTYNLFVSAATRDFLLVSSKALAAESFCNGWLSAGGAINGKEYKKNRIISEALFFIGGKLAMEVEAVHKATCDWCDKNGVPIDIFSGPLCFLPLQKNKEEKIDTDILDLMRSAFDKIKLTES